MALSYNEYTADGTQTLFASKPYLQEEHLVVSVDGVVQPTSAYTVSGTAVTLNVAPAATAKVRIGRNTSQSLRLTDYADASLLTADVLDADANQLFFMTQEAIDTASETNLAGVTFYNSSATAPADPSVGDLWYDTYNKYLQVYNGTEWQLATPSNETLTFETFSTEGSYSYINVAGLNEDVFVFLNGVKQVKDSDKANLLAVSGAKDFFLDLTNSRVYFKTLASSDVVQVILAPADIGNNQSTQLESFTATAGQTVFNLVNSYIPATNTLHVYVNGVRQSAYTETNATAVTFTSGLTLGDEVVFITNQYVQAQSFTAATNVTYTPAGTGAVATTVQEKLRETVSVKDFGAVGDGVTDDTAAIQAALDSGASGVYVPSGTFAHSGLITVTSTRLYGTGTLLSTDPATLPSHAIKLTGSGSSIVGLTVDTNWTGTRQQNNNSVAILVSSADDFLVSDCKVNNSASAGIFVTASSFGRVVNNIVEDTLADGIHNTDGSNNISIVGNVINNSGDDSIAIVGYAAQSTQVSTFTITGNVSNFSNARGIVAIGAANVTISGNTVFAPDVGGIRASAESSYSTYPCENILISGNTVIDPNTSNTTLVGGISLDGYLGFLAKNITINGNVISYTGDRNCFSAAINITNEYAEDTIISNNSICGNAAHNSSGINLACKGAIVKDNNLKDLTKSGVVITSNAYGTLEILNNVLINCNTSSSASDAPINLVYSSNVDSCKIAGNNMRDSLDSIRIGSGYNSTELLVIDNYLENIALTEKTFDGQLDGSDYTITLNKTREAKAQSVYMTSSDTFKVIADGRRHSPVKFTFQGVATSDQNRAILLEEYWRYSTGTGGGVLGTDYVALTSGGYYVRTAMNSFSNGNLGVFSMTEDGANKVTITFNPNHNCQFNASIKATYKSS